MIDISRQQFLMKSFVVDRLTDEELSYWNQSLHTDYLFLKHGNHSDEELCAIRKRINQLQDLIRESNVR